MDEHLHSLFYSRPNGSSPSYGSYPVLPSLYSSRALAIQALQEEVEGLRKDINALKKVVADKEFEILVCLRYSSA